MVIFFGVGRLFSSELTGPERIVPDINQINRCVPETMKEGIFRAIKGLPKVEKVVEELSNLVHGEFLEKCREIAVKLEELDQDALLNTQNIGSKFCGEDAVRIFKILTDENAGLRKIMETLKNTDLHLGSYVTILYNQINKDKVDIISLIHSVDLVQRSVLELQEYLQLLSYLKYAYQNITEFSDFVGELRHLLCFKINFLLNSLTTLTEDLRVVYLSFLDKGDCTPEQIVFALGINHRKKQAIKQEQ